MSAPSSAVTKAVAEVEARADALDRRRRKQITNQIMSIDRLLRDATYDDEMRTLHEQLAEAQAQLDEVKAELQAVQDELDQRREEQP